VINKKIFLIIFPLFFILAATRSIEQIKWLSYSAPFFFLLFIVNGVKELKNKELKFSLLLIAAFGIWAMTTSLWSTFPRESFVRSAVFIFSSGALIMGGFSWIRYYKENEFGYLLPLNFLLIIASLFSLITKMPNDYWAGYGFGLKSFWGHQNTLGSLILFSIPGIFILPMKNKKIGLLFILLLIILNVYILTSTHSRTSLVVLVLSTFLFILLSKQYKIFGTIILLCAGVSIFYFTNATFQSKLNNYLFKTEVSLLDRKKPVITSSYEAALHGGWKGLGFGVSDTTVNSNLQLNIHYHFEGVRLVREKGVSIFAIIEETGWVGLILFLIFIVYLFYLSVLAYLKNIDWHSVLMICLLFGMVLHAQLEGWWLGVGSVQFPLIMAVAGIAGGKVSLLSAKTNNEIS
jgi:hypothetical protein